MLAESAPWKFCQNITVMLTCSQVSNGLDSPLINYSISCHPPQPYSALPVYYFWRILLVSPFILDTSFINSYAESAVVAWSLGKATKLFDVHVFLISITLISIYRLKFGSRYSCRQTTFVFIMFFLLIFSQDRLMILFQWKFQLLCFASLSVYWLPPLLLFFVEVCQPPCLYHPSLLLETRE